MSPTTTAICKFLAILLGPDVLLLDQRYWDIWKCLDPTALNIVLPVSLVEQELVGLIISTHPGLPSSQAADALCSV